MSEVNIPEIINKLKEAFAAEYRQGKPETAKVPYPKYVVIRDSSSTLEEIVYVFKAPDAKSRIQDQVKSQLKTEQIAALAKTPDEYRELISRYLETELINTYRSCLVYPEIDGTLIPSIVITLFEEKLKDIQDALTCEVY